MTQSTSTLIGKTYTFSSIEDLVAHLESVKSQFSQAQDFIEGVKKYEPKIETDIEEINLEYYAHGNNNVGAELEIVSENDDVCAVDKEDLIDIVSDCESISDLFDDKNINSKEDFNAFYPGKDAYLNLFKDVLADMNNIVAISEVNYASFIHEVDLPALVKECLKYR